MRRIISVILVSALVATTVAKATDVPPYFTSVHGGLVAGILDRASFVLQPGQLGTCVRTEVGDIVEYNCPLTNASAVVSDSQKGSQAFAFNTVTLSVRESPDSGILYDYHFHGAYDAKVPAVLHSSTELELSYFGPNPTVVSGNLSLPDFNVSGVIQAVQ